MLKIFRLIDERSWTGMLLERAQEINEILLLLGAQPIETLDDLVRLAAAASVGLDRLDQVGRSSVMEEEDPLPNAPERSCSELIGTRAALRDAVRETSAHVVDEKVGEELCRLVGQRAARASRGAACNRLACGERGSVAEGTAYLCENGPSIHGGRRIERGGWRGQHPHEVGKRLDVRDNGCIRLGGGPQGGGEVKRVLGRGVEDAARSLVALLREQLVRDPHLDVVRLAREQEKGLVLRLPSKAGDRPVVRAAVGIAAQVRVRVTGNAQRLLQVRLGLHVRENRRVGYRLDEPSTKDGSRDAEDDVRISA